LISRFRVFDRQVSAEALTFFLKSVGVALQAGAAWIKVGCFDLRILLNGHSTADVSEQVNEVRPRG
jgi:hypothetical protein